MMAEPLTDRAVTEPDVLNADMMGLKVSVGKREMVKAT